MLDPGKGVIDQKNYLACSEASALSLRPDPLYLHQNLCE